MQRFNRVGNGPGHDCVTLVGEMDAVREVLSVFRVVQSRVLGHIRQAIRKLNVVRANPLVDNHAILFEVERRLTGRARQDREGYDFPSGRATRLAVIKKMLVSVFGGRAEIKVVGYFPGHDNAASASAR